MIPHDAGRPDPSHFPPLNQPHSPREVGSVPGRIGEVPSRPMPLPMPPAPLALSAAPDFWSLLAALKQRWISAIVLGGLLGSLAAIGMWVLLTPKHTAFAKVTVSFQQPRFDSKGEISQNDFKTFVQTTAGRLQSRPVIWAALKRDEVRRLNLEARGGDPIQTIEDDLKVEARENTEIITIQFSHADPQVATVVTGAIQEAFLEQYVYAEDKRKAARITELEKAISFSQDTIGGKQKNLEARIREMKEFDPALWREQRNEARLALRDGRQKQTEVQFKLVEARAQLDVFEARVKAMKNRKDAPMRSPVDRIPKPDVPKPTRDDIEAGIERTLDSDPRAKKYLDQITYWEGEMSDWERKGFRKTHVSYVTAKERAESAHRQLARLRGPIEERVRKGFAAAYAANVKAAEQAYDRKVAEVEEAYRDRMEQNGNRQQPTSDEEIAVVRDQLKRQVTGFEEIDKELNNRIVKLSEETVKTPTMGIEYEQLVGDIRNDEALLSNLRTNLERERLEMRAARRVNKLQDSELMKKDTKKQMLASLVAPIAVLCSVCGGLALLEHRKRKVRSAGEISRGLGIRVVGAVPRMAHLERQLVGPTGESELEGTPVMESIDAIRTRLLHEADVRATRVVLVTSAGAGEGKTTLAAALASSLARAGRKTLLLDGDLRRPTVHELFEVPMQPGFSEVLLGEIEVAEAVAESTQENLSLLPAGQWDREVLIALSRDGLTGVFEKLAEEFDFIVVDSHPVLSANDSLLLGRQADAVVLSVLREVSQMPRVYAAHQQLTGLGIRVLGAVVSGTDPEEAYGTQAATPATV